MNTTRWLLADLDSWWSTLDSVQGTGEDHKHAHKLWEHAEQLVAGRPSTLALSDAVLVLNRAVRLRLDSLERVHFFSKAPGLRPGSRGLERLTHFKLVRPLVLRRLMGIRNSIEHQDAAAPSVEEIEALVDTVWYFLRSTDSLVALRSPTVTLHPEEHEDYALTITLETSPQWVLRVRGWLPGRCVSDSALTDGIQIATTRIVPRSDLADAIIVGDGRGRMPSDLLIEGEVASSTNHFQDLAVLIFNHRFL
jgi:hypothetical protein